MKFSNLYKLLLILFLVVGIIRFWKIPELGYFMMDEERDAFLVRRLLVDHRPLLIGGAVPGGLYLGPLFFYLSAIPYVLTGLNPVGPAYAAAVIGVISVVATYIVGRKLFDSRVALIASVFSTFSLLNIIYHRPWWPLTLSQLVTLGVYLALIQLTRLKNFNVLKHYSPKKWFLMLIGLLVVGAQTDPSTLSLMPLSIIWLGVLRRRVAVTNRMILGGIGLFLLAHTSVFVFELRHDFPNTKAISRLIAGPFETKAVGFIAIMQMTTGLIYRLFIPTGPLDVTGQINPATQFLSARAIGIWWPGAIFLATLIGGYILRSLFVRRKFDDPSQLGRKLLSLHLVIALFGIVVYTLVFPGYIHEWMWAFMFPTFFLIMADMLMSLLGKVKPFVAGVMGLILVIWSGWQMTLMRQLTNVAGLGAKLDITRTAQEEIDGRPYELQSQGEFRYGGWRYLFNFYGNPPVKSYMDYVYQDWLYLGNDADPEVVVVINNSRDKPATFTISENSEPR